MPPLALISIRHTVLRETSNTPDSRDRALSARELQVIEMATQGLTNAQIAVALNVSVHAVKFHLASIYRKLRVANRTEAAVTYLRLQTGGG